MTNLSDVRKALSIAADLFEASPIKTFTREQVVETLRKLPDEIEHIATVNAASEIPGQERMS